MAKHLAIPAYRFFAIGKGIAMARRPDLGYFENGLDLLARQTYEAALRPFGEAEQLPAFAYTALPFALLEDEAVWTREWVCIGTLADIPEFGDVLPFTVGNHGIHVQRMPNGALEGRFNNAQHGGCRFVPVQCQGGTKTKCSFTSCGYSRDRDAIAAREDGQGVAAMHQYLGLRPERLLKVSVATWGKLILVNVDGPGKRFVPPVEFDKVLAQVVPTSACRTAKHWREYDCNWKIVGEALVSSRQASVKSLPSAVIARQERANEVFDTAMWLFPNVVVLSSHKVSAIIILQQTSLKKVLCRIQVFSKSDSADAEAATAALLSEIETRSAMAVDLQSWRASSPELFGQLQGHTVQSDAIGYWVQTKLIGNVLSLPRPNHEAPMFQSTRHYSI